MGAGGKGTFIILREQSLSKAIYRDDIYCLKEPVI